MVTLASLFNGFLSIVAASRGNFRLAALLIIFGMVFDFLDGRLARFLHTDSEMGKELDSFADLVTFGVAPAFLVYSGSLHQFPVSGLIVSGLIPVSVALRLARFNTKSTPKNVFIGLPSTIGGGFIAFIYGFFNVIPSKIMLVFTIVVAVFMVSSFPYYKMPKLPRYSIKNIKFTSIIILGSFLLLKFNRFALLSIGIIYILSGFLIFTFRLFRQIPELRRGLDDLEDYESEEEKEIH